MKKSPLRVIAAACIVLACAAFVLGLFVAFLTNKSAAERDFIEYWAAGQQLTRGANPYDAAEILRLERAAGLEGNHPRITFSPPVAFFLTLPLGFVSPKAGLILWLVLLLFSLWASIGIIWVLSGRPDNGLHFGAILFPPAIACLMAGQIGLFLLLGVVLFLYCHNSHPFLAGATLLPCAMKPHLFLPFSIVLFLWVITRKVYRILFGFLGALIASCVLTLCFDAHVWAQYSQMMGSTGVLHAFVPTLSVAFRFLIDPNAVWLQFLPEIGACLWALWYFWAHHTHWSWMDQGLLVLLVSAVCTPYAWFSDEAVLLPAVLCGVYRASEHRRSLLPIVIIAGIALIEVYTIGEMSSRIYLWTTPAWLGWYLYANATKSAPTQGSATI